jgi:hypothetical protein
MKNPFKPYLTIQEGWETYFGWTDDDGKEYDKVQEQYFAINRKSTYFSRWKQIASFRTKEEADKHLQTFVK